VQDLQRRLARLEDAVETLQTDGSVHVKDLRREFEGLEGHLDAIGGDLRKEAALYAEDVHDWREKTVDRLARMETKITLAGIVAGATFAALLGVLGSLTSGLVRLR
jgi:hypothetical protein